MNRRTERVYDIHQHGWTDSLVGTMHGFDEDRVRAAYAQFQEGLRQGRSIVELQRELDLSESQVKRILYLMKNRGRGTKKFRPNSTFS